MTHRKFRFGPFELDAAQQELRKRGIRRRLPASRIRLLLLFVTRSGDLITRKEIADCLWTEVQTVDVITGINTAVNQLRTQLGDDSGSPKYIETVIGSGYRFIAPVTEVEEPPQPLASKLQDVSSATLYDPEPQPGQPEQLIQAGLTQVDATQPVLENLSPSLSVSLISPQPAAFVERPQRTRTLAIVALVTVSLLASLVFVLRRTVLLPVTPQGDLNLVRITDSGDIHSADISPDGKFAAYVRDIGGKQSLWLKQLATGRVTQLALMGQLDCPGLAFSPDGSYIYFVRKQLLEPQGELDRISFLGGEPTKVLDGISGAPAISPDGNKVAFIQSTLVTHGLDSVVTAAIDAGGQSSAQRTLATYEPPGVHLNRITWTADGRSLVFPMQSTLMILPADGGTAAPLTVAASTSVEDLYRLPPGEDLVIVGEAAKSRLPQVMQISLKEQKISPITHDLTGYVSVRSTLDGKRILAVQDLVLSNIQIVTGKNYSEVRALSAVNQARNGVDGLGWTPDGKLVYLSSTEKSTEVMETDDAGTNRSRIADSEAHTGFFSDVAFSPGNRFFAVTRWTEDNHANIWRVDRGGGGERPLTFGTQDTSPSITPDGQWVVYASVQAGGSVLMKVPSEGGTPVRLTDYDTDALAVSPDGKWIACSYTPHQDQPPALAIVPVTGGPPALVFKLPDAAAASTFAWTPDGKAVGFISNTNGVGNIWQQPVNGGHPVRVTQFTSGSIFNFQWSADGRLALSRGTEMIDAVLLTDFRAKPR